MINIGRQCIQNSQLAMHDLDLNLTQRGYDCLVPITYGASLLSYFTVHYLAAIEIKHEDAKVSHPQNNCRLTYTAMLGAFTSRAVARFVTKLNTRAATACPSRFKTRNTHAVVLQSNLINHVLVPKSAFSQAMT